MGVMWNEPFQWRLHKVRWKIYWRAVVSLWVTLSKVLFEGCEHCGAVRGVELESSRTMYHWENYHGREDTPADPNRRVRLCRDCAAEHHQHWDSMWDDYYSGLL